MNSLESKMEGTLLDDSSRFIESQETLAKKTREQDVRDPRSRS